MNREAISAKEREELIIRHLPQVRLLARKIAARSGGSLQIEDLISAGILGLIAAVDNYDSSRQIKLNTYAEHRIRGAMLDTLRGADFASRSAKLKAKSIENAIRAVQQRTGMTAEEAEIAAELSISLDEYHQLLLDVQNISVESFDAPQFDGDEESSLVHRIAAKPENSPSRQLERAETQRILQQEIALLPKREQQVLSMYFQHEVTPGEIARIMNLRLARVSQLKAQALLRLRSALTGRIAMKS